MNVTISFIEKIAGKDDKFVLTTVVTGLYPSYQAGQNVWLQISDRQDHTKDMKLTQYKILDVCHSLRDTVHRTLGAMSYLGMEVYVRKLA